MSVIYILLPISLVFGAGALVFFIWALRTGQFDDLQTPAHRILFDEDRTNLMQK
ncbi:MAG: cbb3-type cytochrome oxidase assembly protein CcoS [SAR324 cluster bacterium]|nr:cbb3-type cytochrome oxidase assembly protein CcoS [SAR324 cluster bacterium]